MALPPTPDRVRRWRRLPDSISPELQDLIAQMLRRKATHRYTLEKVRSPVKG